jgi:hypothetical protein
MVNVTTPVMVFWPVPDAAVHIAVALPVGKV